MKKKKPVIIILYNRPKHTEKLFNSIINAKNYNRFNFYVFCDGAKNQNDIEKINEIKTIVKSFKKKINIKTFYRKKNIGLILNITNSINSVLSKNNFAIILEDDLVLHKNFFNFMDVSLEKYKKNDNVFQISGYSYPIKNYNKKHYFLSLSSCWGWAITARNWKNFAKFLNNKKLLMFYYLKIKKNSSIKNSFNYGNSYNYFSMLKKFFNNKVNSWGIIFYLYLFVENKLTLFPNNSLVRNIGFDGSGNHKSKNNLFNSEFQNTNLSNFPDKVVEKSIHRLKVENFFKENLSLYAKIKNRIYEKIN